MTNTDLVRASRDGDQFHYLWAARRCLSLLDLRSGLVAVAVEGASRVEASGGDHLEAGEELIDVAEYYGSEEILQADRIAYIQLKHSTYRSSEAWSPSGVEKTLRGFSDRYRELLEHIDKAYIQSRVTFCFVSNRPIQSQLLESVVDAANGNAPRHVKIFAKLKQFTGLDGQDLSDFCSLLRLEGNEDGYWEQRNILFQGVSGYLSDLDADAPVQLKELVTRKALSESTETPTITRLDVLRALKVGEQDLFPAPCLIRNELDAVAREQESEFTSAIIDASDRPIIVHAAGGVGKSVFATRIGLGLPEGSVCVLYDCFGNGQYRNASKFRHRHKDAIPEIANELAGQGLCHPLIPTPNADPTAYMRAFLHRLEQSVTTLKAKDPNAILCITVDAADNAQMAAEEIGECKSFVRDLLRETMPEGVRLVALCRSHRQEMLDPPPNVQPLELRPFSRAETAAFLRLSYPDATEHDVDEFHRLSSQNPRVQALAMDWESPLAEVLRKLGPTLTTVEDTIGTLLDQAIATLRDAAGSIERDQIDRMCRGLAALRPLIPIPVLASMSDVPATAIKSFAFDFGPPINVTDGTIQFLDEPTETWFRENFMPTSSDLSAFVSNLRPLASKSPYVASVLPQLMLEARQYPELVALALSSEGLPDNSPLERRDVELQRLQFALKASLRSKRYLDASKLAMKAAGETAGDDRQRRLLQENTDLAAVFLEVDGIQEVVSRRTFGSGWMGSHHAYEAGLMSGNANLAGDARSRLRMTYQWLKNWSRLPDEERQSERVSVEDIAEIAMADLNIHGVESSAHSIRRWRPRSIGFQAGAILARRLVDHGRYRELEKLSFAAGNDLCLLLAITREMRAVHRNPPDAVIGRALRLVLRIKLGYQGPWGNDESISHAVLALVEAALMSGIHDTTDLVAILNRQLPEEPRLGLASSYGNARFVLVRAYTLRAALVNQPIDLADLAHPDLKKQLQNDSKGQSSREVNEFKENIGSLLPWHRLWAEVALGRVSEEELLDSVERTRAESGAAKSSWYREEFHINNEIAHLWLQILVAAGGTSPEAVAALGQWVESLKRPLFTSTLTHIARLKARTTGLEAHALEDASRAFQLVNEDRDNAEAKTEAYIGISRAILIVSSDEAQSYFDLAVEVASKIGDEVVDRWDATLDLADRGATADTNHPEIAYRLARCGELIYEYMARDKYFDWKGTVDAIGGLCPSSIITILSRWRDRAFGSSARSLAIAAHTLTDRRELHPTTSIALLPFRVNWRLPALLDASLTACSTLADRQAVLDFFGRYESLEEKDSETWHSIKRVCASHGLEFPDIDDFIQFAERREQSNRPGDNGHLSDFSNTNNAYNLQYWDAIFHDVDLTVAVDVARSYDRFRSYGPPYHNAEFFREVCQRVPIGKEARFIDAIGSLVSFDLHDYRSFFEQIPESWKGRVSIKQALASLIKIVFIRFCMEITKSRHYQRFPLELASEVSGFSESELIETVLSAIGEATQIVSASRLFTLVGLLAPTLTDGEARDALSFTLYLLEDSLEESDGDGPWSETLTPPGEIEEAIAGYLWAALAAPQASQRWEAAHSVRGMCALGQTGVLDHLMRMLANGGGSPFVDAGLHFYELHARQWFLIAIARASKESPALIVPYGEQLSQIALGGTKHILIREFAARAALALIDSGHLSVSADEKKRLAQVNRSSFPTVQSKLHERMGRDLGGPSGDPDEGRFSFGIDMGPYWFGPLGRCFGVSQSGIECRARDVIRDDFGFSGGNRWDDDQRARRGVFKDRETHHSHGSYPRTDDLRFYLSYHAMMVVAGHLLAKVPLNEDPDAPWDDFEDWFSRHDLARDDGGWSADRRDPKPLEWPEWKNETSVDEWNWSLASDDFDRVLFDCDDKIVAWGNWTAISRQRQETVRISSALVSPDCSRALLRALQTATNAYDYRMPDADDHWGEIDQNGFLLKGWVVEETKESGIDRQDPWAGDIQFPPIRPAKFVRELMGLRSDPEQRSWHSATEGQNPVIWSRLWGHFRDGDDEGDQESGQRFEASMSFIQQLLTASATDLLVEVQVSRRARLSRYLSWEDEGIGYTMPYAKLFLIRGDGSVFTI